MKHAVTLCTIATVLVVAGVVFVRTPAPAGASPHETGAVPFMVPPLLSGPVAPLPELRDLDRGKVALGDRLFHDPRLSRDASISCASCHDLARGGVDGKQYSVGVGGAIGTINTPTVLNSRFQFRLFWDGRAATLEEQIEGPIHHPSEMGADWTIVIDRLKADPTYVREFDRLYAGALTSENVRHAIAEFERSLVTADSAFDMYLRGDASAMTPLQVRGWELFQELGCITCHQGINLGGNSFQALSLDGRYFTDRGGEITTADLGRFNVTGLERDRHRFKVPTLRNVALTAPYLHDGTAETLEETVQIMAKYQLGIELADEEVGAVVAFLRSLTGTLQRRR